MKWKYLTVLVRGVECVHGYQSSIEKDFSRSELEELTIYELLEKVGNCHWELVCVIALNTKTVDGREEFKYFFKRPWDVVEKWEYMKIEMEASFGSLACFPLKINVGEKEAIDSAGKEGWELVSSVPGVIQGSRVHMMKRRLP